MKIRTDPNIIIVVVHESATTTTPDLSGKSLSTSRSKPREALGCSDAVRFLGMGLPHRRRSEERDPRGAWIRRGRPVSTGELI